MKISFVCYEGKLIFIIRTLHLACLVPRSLSVFHLGQSVSGHVVRAKKRGLDKNQKLGQISQFFWREILALSGSRHGGKIGRGGKFELIFDANASVDMSLSSV